MAWLAIQPISRPAKQVASQPELVLVVAQLAGRPSQLAKTARLADRLVGRLTGWQAGRVVGRLAGWLAGWLAG